MCMFVFGPVPRFCTALLFIACARFYERVCCFCATFAAMNCNTSDLKLLSGNDQLRSLGSDGAMKSILDPTEVIKVYFLQSESP